MRRTLLLLLAGLVVAGAGVAVGRYVVPQSVHQRATAGRTATTTVRSATTTETGLPFSVMISTSPCFGWDRLLAGPWALRDAVTGRVITGGQAYEGRCGFSVRFSLSPATYQQVSLVYVFDQVVQLVGLNQSNGGDGSILVQGNVGPYTLTAGSVVTAGPELTDCSRLPASCSQG